MSPAAAVPEREAQPFVDSVVSEGRALRSPELFRDRPQLISRTARNGVVPIALPTTALSAKELDDLLLFRLAQYLVVGFANVSLVLENNWRREPRAGVTDRDIHLVAGAEDTGEILAYLTLRCPAGSRVHATLGGRDRPLLPVEEEHGYGIFNRLRLLSDVRISRVRECGRFMKNQFVDGWDPALLRAPVELGAALFQLLIGPLRSEVDAVVGDFEEAVARRNLEYFHAPLVTVEGTLPFVEDDCYLLPRYENSSTYPFALWVADLFAATERLRAIEQGLEVPGDEGLSALLALKEAVSTETSSLEPSKGSSPLNQTRLPQREFTMPERATVRDAAEFLIGLDIFSDLSLAEASVLSTFLERLELSEGDTVVRQGEDSDGLYLIESGTVDVYVRTLSGDNLQIARRGPGECVGEIAIVTSGPRTATVVASSATSLLRLSDAAYTAYLARTGDVQSKLTQTAATRLGETLSDPPDGVRGVNDLGRSPDD